MQTDNEQCPRCSANAEACARMAEQQVLAGAAAYRNAAPLGPLCPPPHDGKVYGLAQMLRAPGKTFTRKEVLAVLRAQRGVAGNVADSEYGRLISIFEAME